MALLYDARYSFVLLRPKNKVELSTQSAERWMCMEKWAVPSLAFFSPRCRYRFRTEMFLMTACLQTPK